MTHKEIKVLIGARIRWINQILNDNYQSSYYSHYGGWNFYKLEGTRQIRGEFGFFNRVSSREFLCYLEGLYNALYNSKYKPEIFK